MSGLATTSLSFFGHNTRELHTDQSYGVCRATTTTTATTTITTATTTVDDFMLHALALL
jgi:hypothetical protein